MNDDYQKRAREIQVLLQAAREIDSMREILSALIDLSMLLIENHKSIEAANLLAFILNHRDVTYDVFDRADDLFIELETDLCPRVITDARDQARYTTLRGAIEAAFAALEL